MVRPAHIHRFESWLSGVLVATVISLVAVVVIRPLHLDLVTAVGLPFLLAALWVCCKHRLQSHLGQRGQLLSTGVLLLIGAVSWLR